jgi:hypothetical protein
VPVEIDAETGQALGENLAKGLTAAARRQLQFGEAVDQTGPSERPMLRHLFGLNLPERDQA